MTSSAMNDPLARDMPPALARLGEKALAGERLAGDEALTLYEQLDLHSLVALAHAVRLRRHPERVVTYVVDRNINYSNVCSCGCKFCAFFAPPTGPGAERGYVLDRATLARKVEETLALGGSQILMQGGHHPELPLSFYEDMLRFLKSTYPQVHIHAFSPPEIVYFAEQAGLTPTEVIRRLREAGLDSIPGGGAEILVDRVRRLTAPNKCSSAAWLDVMRQAHAQGLRTTATMMFGHEETPAERIEHLLAVRALQDETGGFTAFIPWAFQPAHTAMALDEAGAPRRPASSCAYVRMLAVSRLALDNVANLQASWVTMGPQIAQFALTAGANDFGSTMIEENVVAAAGVSFKLPEETIRRLIREAGFEPRRRRMAYELREDDYQEGNVGGGNDDEAWDG